MILRKIKKMKYKVIKSVAIRATSSVKSRLIATGL
jgi:hypothetical protein